MTELQGFFRSNRLDFETFYGMPSEYREIALSTARELASDSKYGFNVRASTDILCLLE